MTRDHRLIAAVALFLGAFVGRSILGQIGTAGTMGVGVGFRVLITLSWIFVPNKPPRSWYSFTLQIDFLVCSNRKTIDPQWIFSRLYLHRSCRISTTSWTPIAIESSLVSLFSLCYDFWSIIYCCLQFSPLATFWSFVNDLSFSVSKWWFPTTPVLNMISIIYKYHSPKHLLLHRLINTSLVQYTFTYCRSRLANWYTIIHT